MPGRAEEKKGSKQQDGMRRHKEGREMGRKRMKGIKGVEEMKSHHRNKTTEEPRQISSLWGSPSRVVIDGQDGLGLDIIPRRCDDATFGPLGQ